MYYVTVKQSPMYRQMSIEELLFSEDPKPALINPGTSNTRTYEVEKISERFSSKSRTTSYLINTIAEFNNKYKGLLQKDRRSMYNTFYIPKKSGGLRRIDAPNEELMTALSDLKHIFENDFRAKHHTSAFAYVKGRDTVRALERHQSNKSKWFEKLDLHDFFGSTTKDFVIHMFSMIFPFSEVIKDDRGRAEFEKAIDLAFLNGGLPQGTPVSPIITNIMMVPIDFNVSKSLNNMENGQKFVYTRYADDFLISSRYDFDFRKIESVVVGVLKDFGAPFNINEKKTRYGSSAGSNWNLGLMLNKDNKITIGHKRKRQFQSMLFNYIQDKKKGVKWDLHDVEVMNGLYHYYLHIEKESISGIVAHINEKNGVNVVEMIRDDLR